MSAPRQWQVFLCVLCALCAGAACRRTPAPAPPLEARIDGTIAIAGLEAPVRVVRDTWGVPHIYAASQNDLFVAQGFVQAQDRLFQMDLWRRTAQGRLSEVLGPNFIERDAMTRRMQYRGDLAAEWASYGGDAKAIAGAFVRGINAWVALARERRPEEFVLAGWMPEAWQPEDLLNRSEAFTASGDALDEIFRARLIAAVGVARARLLLAGDRDLQVPAGLEPEVVPDLVADALRRVGTAPFFIGLAAPAREGTVHGDATGLPADGGVLRRREHPSLRYFVHLTAPGWNVIGVTAPWRPGVAEGHNDRVAWTAEPIDADTQDVYVEKLNPANPRQVEDARGWTDIDVRRDRIAVRGRKTPLDFDRETTRHGVIVASDLIRHLAFAIRWSGHQPGAAAELGALALDRAASPAGFAAALARWKMPARRIVYVDSTGARGAQIAALVPTRSGFNGALPVPGWISSMEWGAPATPGPGVARSPAATAVAPLILETARLHPDRADLLLQQLAMAASAGDSLLQQRARIVDAVAEALRERERRSSGAVLFAHPLAVTEAARRRFNIVVRPPAGAGPSPLAIIFDTRDWDRSTAIDGPGQSGSPDSAHFADLAQLWASGKTFPLAFSEAAVQSHAAATLTLAPR